MTRDWEAFEVGYATVREWLGTIPDAAWNRASSLPGWTVSDLAAHFCMIATATKAIEQAGVDAEPRTVGRYLSAYAAAATEIADITREGAGGAARTLADVQRRMDDELNDARRTVKRLASNPVVHATRGPIRLDDYLRTRAIEVAVHADDLARSVPEAAPPALPRLTQRLAVRALLDVLAANAPGRSVEVRVPPFAAAQVIAGPRHTRGTPSNVIETSPVIWLRLATGRATWADALASGEVSASGDRADLSAHLPLL